MLVYQCANEEHLRGDIIRVYPQPSIYTNSRKCKAHLQLVFRMVRSGPVLKEKPDRTEKFGPVRSGPKFRTGPNRKFGPVLGPVLRSKFQFLFLKKKNQNYLM